MNIYDLHSNPKELFGYDIAVSRVPDVFMPEVMKKKKRRPDLEPYIMKDPESAYYYAKNILEKRWAEAEPHIMQNPTWAYAYARNILKKRWPEAEPYIQKDPEWWKEYKDMFLKNR